MRARDVMTPAVVSCRLSDTAQFVAMTLLRRNIGSVPVFADARNDHMLGIITDRDLCCRMLASGFDPRTARIGSFMTRDVVTCDPRQSLSSCLRLMRLHRVRRLPVVDRQGKCVGFISQADVARWESSENVQRALVDISHQDRTVIIPPSDGSQLSQGRSLFDEPGLLFPRLEASELLPTQIAA